MFTESVMFTESGKDNLDMLDGLDGLDDIFLSSQRSCDRHVAMGAAPKGPTHGNGK